MNPVNRELLGVSHEAFERGDIPAARAAVDAAMLEAESRGDAAGVRATMVNDAAVAIREREFERARAQLTQLLDGTYGSLSKAEAARCRVNLATVLIEVGDLDKAVRLLRSSRSDFGDIEGENSPGVASCVYHLAIIAAKAHEIDAARALTDEARRRYEDLGRPVDALLAAHLVAVVSARVGDWRAVLEADDEIRAELLRRGLRTEWAQCTAGWATALQHAGDDEAAAAALDDALRALPDYATLERAQLLFNRANARRKSEPSEAAADYERGREIFESLGSEVDVAIADEALGALASRQGDTARAAELVTGALEVFDRRGDFRLAMNARHNLATVVSASDPDRALRLSLHAVADAEQLRYSHSRLGDRSAWVTEETASIYGFALHQCLRRNLAETTAALAEPWRPHSIPRPDAAGDDVAGAHRLEGPAPLAVRQGAVVVGAGTRLATIDAARGRVADAGAWWMGVIVARDRLVWHLVRPDGPALAGARQLDPVLYRALDACLAVARPADVKSADGDAGVVDAVIRARLRMTPLALDLAVAEARLRALPPQARAMLESDPDVAFAANCGEPELMRLLGRWLIPEPVVAALLAASNPPTLVVSTDHLLARVPWAILGLGADRGEDIRVGDVSAVSLTPPVAFACHAPRRATRTTGTLAISDPTGRLPWARRAIAADVTLGPGTTRAMFLDAMSRRWDSMTYRGHIEPGGTNPLATALCFAPDEDGPSVATANDIITLSRNEGLLAPDRIALIGCDSYGAASSLEWASLATAFLFAGTSELLCTLWPVLDAPEVDDDAAFALASADVLSALTDRIRARLKRYRAAPDDPESRPYRWAGVARVGLRDNPTDTTQRA